MPPTGPIPTKKKPLGCARERNPPPLPRTSDGHFLADLRLPRHVSFAFLETLIFCVDHLHYDPSSLRRRVSLILNDEDISEDRDISYLLKFSYDIFLEENIFFIIKFTKF